MIDYSNHFSDFNDLSILDGKYFLEEQKNGLDGAEGKIDGVSATFLFRTSTNEYTELYQRRIIVCDSDTDLNKGSYITEVKLNGFDSPTTDKWMVITDIDINQISKYAKVQKCNNTLKFKFPNKALINEYPCIFESYISKNSDGTKSNEFFDFNNDISKVLIPSDSITEDLELGHRFIFDNDKNSIYQLKHVDKVSEKDLLILSLRKSMYIPDEDNLELGVANYYSEQDEKEISILNGSNVRLLNSSTMQVEVQCTYNGEVVSNPEVTYSSNNELVCTVDANGLITTQSVGTAIITASFDGVEDTIQIDSSGVVFDIFNIVITPEVSTMKTNRDLQLSGTVLNNGVEDVTETFTWSYENVDGSSEEYASYELVGDDLKVTSKNQYNKDIKIIATLDSDNGVTTEKIIKIISII